jgi:hypothetical protein
MKRVLCGLFILLISIGVVRAEGVFLEAEGFAELGGWSVDTQSMEQMGSAYLLAHGLGTTVQDAVTKVTVPKAGKYRLWVRTRDWVAPWKVTGAPGKFEVMIDGKAAPATFGTKGEAWHWQDGGKVTIDKTEVTIALHDLAGFDGRCDAIVLSDDDAPPPNEPKALAQFRRTMLKLGGTKDEGAFDLVVVGGGMAGTCSAISAARQGLKVALIQDRPVLGGNNSSEVRVHLNGEIYQQPYPKLGVVVAELDSEKRGNAQPAGNYDDAKKLAVVHNEDNIRLYLNMRLAGAETKDDKIVAITARDVRASTEHRFAGALFADCTGDGSLGFLAGADFRMGRESRTETGESLAPEKADSLLLGTSVQWYALDAKEPRSFPDCPWALAFNEQTCQPMTRGDWDWETGQTRNPVDEIEFIRDYGLRVVFGNWAYLKNHYSQKQKYENQRLAWVAYIGGKRESRRLLGDIILCQQDAQKPILYPDAMVTATWTIDLHYPNPENTKFFPGEEFRTVAQFTKIAPYPIPYRCFYSRNVGNLFMAGRDISVTHVALGCVRVMRTGGMMGEVVGMAASLCKQHGTTPRGVYEKHLEELKALATKGVPKR